MIIKNFLFHRVSDEKDHLWPPMPVSLFKSLITYITKQYHVVQLEDYILSSKEIKTNKKPATILFDDGYKDNIEYAVPILDQQKCPASFYVVTECIDKNIPTWTYMVDHLLQNTSKQQLILEMNFVPVHFKKNEFATHPARLSFGSKLKPWMKGLSNDQRQQVLGHLEMTFDDVAPPANKMMSWNDLKQMQSAGYMIGSHSVTHPLLASIKNEKELAFEIGESANRIEAKLGKFPVTISYPIGSYDERVMKLSKQAGYKLGLAVKQQFYNTAKDDRFAIPRVELYNEPMWKCKLRISGVYNWVKSKVKNG
jgi:peptidoglycan/xylan/chitin deacetylase (PgdA/CDA1 family)